MCPCELCLLELLLFVVYCSGYFPLGELSGSHDRGQGFSYVYIKESLQLNCTVPESSSWKADDLYFTLDNEFCEDAPCNMTSGVQFVNNQTASLTKLISSVRDGGEYECWIETPQGEHVLVNSHSVYVQYRPQQVENIRCEVYDWDFSLTCSWDFGVEYISNEVDGHSSPAIQVNVSVLTRAGRVVKQDPCPQPSFEEPMKICSWAGTYFYGASQYLLEVIVTNTVTNDSNISHQLIVSSEKVKPSPVKHIWEEDKNSTCIRLSWNHTRIHRAKVFRLNTSSGALENHRIVNQTSEWICGLSPYTSYTFSVECHAMDNITGRQQGFWSDPKSVDLTTAESEPSSSFKVHGGGYILHTCDGNERRNITIFLKAVPPAERNGNIIGYRLKYNGTVLDVNQTNPTSATLLNVPCSDDITLSIYSRTKVGPSKQNARLVIVQDEKELVPEFAVKMSAGELHAVWNAERLQDRQSTTAVAFSGVEESGEAEETEDVTVFWCLSDKSLSDRLCKGEVEWQTAKLNSGELQIPYPQWHDPRDYLYGISYKGHALTWTNCIFSPQEGIKAPDGVAAYLDSQGLNIQWMPQRCSAEDYPVHITKYRIHICEKDRCPETSRMVYVEGGESFQETVSNAKDAEYEVRVQAGDSEGRLGPFSDPVIAPVPRSKGVPVWMILVIVLGIVLLFVAVGLAVLCRLRFSNLKRNFEKKMDFPEFVPQGAPTTDYFGVPSSPTHAGSYPQTTETVVEVMDEGEYEDNSAVDGFTGNYSAMSSEYTHSISDSTEGLPGDTDGAAMPVPLITSAQKNHLQAEELKCLRYSAFAMGTFPSSQQFQTPTPDQFSDGGESVPAYSAVGANSAFSDQLSESESVPAYIAVGTNSAFSDQLSESESVPAYTAVSANSDTPDQISDGGENVPAYMAVGTNSEAHNQLSDDDESVPGGTCSAIPHQVDNKSVPAYVSVVTNSDAPDQLSESGESVAAYAAVGGNSAALDQLSGGESVPVYTVLDADSASVAGEAASGVRGSGEVRMSAGYAPRPTSPQKQPLGGTKRTT